MGAASRAAGAGRLALGERKAGGPERESKRSVCVGEPLTFYYGVPCFLQSPVFVFVVEDLVYDLVSGVCDKLGDGSAERIERGLLALFHLRIRTRR